MDFFPIASLREQFPFRNKKENNKAGQYSEDAIMVFSIPILKTSFPINNPKFKIDSNWTG